MGNNLLRNRGLFRRVFILYIALVLLSALFVELYVTETVRENTIRNMRENLSIQASLIADSVSFTAASPPLDGFCKQMKETTGARVTIIALDGAVLGDSDSPSVSMDNHGHRQEVQQAALNGIGMAIRLSDTLKYDLLYVAKKIMRGPEPEGFIRLSVPLVEVDRSINLLRLKLILVVTLILFGTGIVSLWQLDRIRRLTARIRDFSRAVARGELDSKLYLERAGEFDEIAESLNSMSRELKRGIAAHEEEQRRLNVILRSIPDALFIIDSGGTILLSSTAARKLFGETAIQGKPFIEVVRNTEFLSLVEGVRKRQTAGVAEVRIGSPLEQYCVVQVSPLFYGRENELSGLVAIFHDITQLKRLEQTRKDFVANISHEIKTPITAIKGFAETLLEGALDDRENAAKFLRTIQSNSERIDSLVDDLMTISKLELGVLKIEKKDVALQEVIDHVLTLLKDKAVQKNLTVETRMTPGKRTMSADRDRLIQILTNLVDNAIKFTDKGKITIGMEEQAGKTCLFVADTGIGIPQKHLSRIGERFYRVDPGRSRQMGGTGLGLAIVKHLVKAHGWEMQIESTPGKGTKVRIVAS